MVLGGQTGTFNPSSNRVSSPQVKPAVDATKAAVSPKKESDELLIKAGDQHQDLKQVQEEVKTQKAVQADTFSSRIQAGQARNKLVTEQAVAKFANDKQIKRQQAENFASKIDQSKTLSQRSSSVQADPDLSNNQVLQNQVVQSQIESIDPDAKARKKLDDKLKKIHSLGGEKGKHFVSFVQREMSKGPLSNSIAELVDGFLETLQTKDSLSPSEMIQDGKEPLVVLRHMVSSDDLDEQIKIRNSLATTTISSAGEKSDLLAIRNLIKVSARRSPPSPVNGSGMQVDKLKLAAEFAISINKGSAMTAPWDAITQKAA